MPMVREHRPAFTVEEVDPTGAGDCFGATSWPAARKAWSAGAALRYACASGALAVGVRGPMEGTATFAELDAFIREAECNMS